jgi:hypothetical protein
MMFGRLCAPTALLVLQACTAVPTADGQRLKMASPEFRAYVERVFREQNRVADEVAFALEADGATRKNLVAAEQRLLEACAGVNELATTRRDEQRLGVRHRAAAARSVPACEQATKTAAAMLEDS